MDKYYICLSPTPYTKQGITYCPFCDRPLDGQKCNTCQTIFGDMTDKQFARFLRMLDNLGKDK